ncbi:class II aldolase/adducin family protein [Caldimonas brevitalea]|uniref:class II aldolase/adducin family protein n=1 Tax=Caldimonas brevitalea TaxID=413882 RepID=UPI0009F8A1F6
MGQVVAHALGEHTAVLLCNQGLVVVADTPRQSVVLALMLERACRIQLLAESQARP